MCMGGKDVRWKFKRTRPKPAFGRHGLAGSWGQNIDEVSTFLVFFMSHFAPAVLSSDLTNLGSLMTMNIHLETLEPWKPTKNHENHETTWKTMETNQKPWNYLEKPWKPTKNHEKPWNYVTWPTRGPNWPPWLKKRDVTHTGSQPTF